MPDERERDELERLRALFTDTQTRLNASRANNDGLRRKLEASELRIRELETAVLEYQQMQSEFLLAAERLTQAHAVLDAAGLLDKLPPVKDPAERLQENDQRTRNATREFGR